MQYLHKTLENLVYLLLSYSVCCFMILRECTRMLLAKPKILQIPGEINIKIPILAIK